MTSRYDFRQKSICPLEYDYSDFKRKEVSEFLMLEQKESILETLLNF